MIPLRDSLPSYSTPYVTMTLIAINVAVFLYMASLDPYSTNYFVENYGMIPAKFSPETMLTCIFVHGGWMHLIGNMWFLWIYGDNVEDVLGRRKYLFFYLLCGVLASTAHLLLNPESQVPTVGASGAIAGVMGAYMAKFPHARIVTLIFIVVFITTVELPAVVILIYWFAIQFFGGIGSIASSTATSGGTAWFAHIGGFAVGYVLIRFMGTTDRYQRHQELRW
jgi:rhomboid family protein